MIIRVVPKIALLTTAIAEPFNEANATKIVKPAILSAKPSP
jgi:hypothetical protein